MDIALWVVQVLLAVAFVGFGSFHTLGFDRGAAQPMTAWFSAVGRERLRIIGILELLGAVGLILPMASGTLPWLTPLAGACLALLMLFAIIFHLRRSGETVNIIGNVVLGLLALFVAYGRFVLVPA